MNVLFFVGGTQTPSSRFRVGQFIPHFESRGIRCTVRAAYGDRYNALAKGPIGPLYKAATRMKRAALSIEAGRYDLVFLQRTALPQTALPERLTARLNPRVIFDFDDAIFLGPRGEPRPARARTFRAVVDLSTHVIAGNEYLAAAAAVPEKTTIIPTVVDASRYVPAPPARDDGSVVLGWMGTTSNFHHLPLMLPAVLRVLDEVPGAVFRLVSNGPYEGMPDHPRIQQVVWSEEAELRELQGFDVGLMPLHDDPWARGKCGFKIIQYMSVQRPVVASAVGANREILAGEEPGFLATDPEGWYRSLRRLATDPGLRERMGRAARARVLERYSITSVIDRYVELFGRVAEERRDG